MTEHLQPPQQIGGIPAWIFDPGISSNEDIEIRGLRSGRELYVGRRSHTLYITDARQYGLCFLQATLLPGNWINYDLQTKGHNRIPFYHHPDFYAQEFALAAHDFFQRQGNPISGLQNHWHNNSDNHRMFLSGYKKSLKRGFSEIEAAHYASQETWTYVNIALPLTYTHITIQDIDSSVEPSFVETLFYS